MTTPETETQKPGRAEVPFAEVEQAVRAEIAEAEPNGWQVSYRLIRRIGNRVRFDADAVDRAWRQRAAEDKFSGQVSRAFGKLADAGVLRKAAAGKPGPDGREVHRHQVAYYTPEMWDAIAARAAEQAELDRAAGARAAAVLDRLEALGVYARPRNEWVYLDLESAERLVQLAEGGMDRHLASDDA